MKIFLIGMPGSGKSTLGERVAKTLHISFIDLDKVIEEQAGKSIPEIFTEKGESEFRKLESALLQTQADQHDNFVMSTGGGAPCFHNGMEIINAKGISIFLNVSLKELLLRNEKQAHRPLLQGDANEKLRTLYAIRLPVYEQANHIISGNNISEDDILRVLNVKM